MIILHYYNVLLLCSFFFLSRLNFKVSFFLGHVHCQVVILNVMVDKEARGNNAHCAGIDCFSLI